MARKRRSIYEVEDLDTLDQPIPKAKVHGVITSLSPVKKGRTCSYFDGTLADGTSKIRVVGFSSSQQNIISNYKTTDQT